MTNVYLEPFDVDNWLKVCRLTVKEEQKEVHPIPNVYYIGISRYEEFTELFAVKHNDIYVGFIGGGLDEDKESGYINPLMIDALHQRKGYARAAMKLMIEYLQEKYNVPRVNLGHRIDNFAAAKLYDSLGFKVVRAYDDEHGAGHYRSLTL